MHSNICRRFKSSSTLYCVDFRGKVLESPWCTMYILLLLGLIYVAGGMDNFGSKLNVFDCYNPTTKQWEELAPMRTNRSHLCLVSYEQYIFAIGGRWGGELTSVEKYDITKVSKEFKLIHIKFLWKKTMYKGKTLFTMTNTQWCS